MFASSTPIQAENSRQPTAVVRWNQAALQGVRASTIGPPMIARALAIVHTCIYDAWAAYDSKASGTQPGYRLRGPRGERNDNDVEKAIGYAAYRCASDLFPASTDTVFVPLMRELGYDPADASLSDTTPQGIGNLAAMAVLNFRHTDGSNQLGNLTASGTRYADYTGYVAVNAPSTVPVNPAVATDVNHWQPLRYTNAAGVFVTQSYLAPYWGLSRSH